MAKRSGYKYVTYLDDNPLSPTYMETYVEKVEDTEKCPIEEDDLVLISNECELSNSGYTGYRISVYFNRTTNEYVEIRALDTECEPSSTEEQWIASGSPYCETTEKGVNTGYMVQVEVQMNPNLSNYGEKRYEKYKSPECEANNCAIWDEVSHACHISVIDCVATFDGTADITEIDINPLSETYNTTRTVNRVHNDCENCTQTTFSWVLVGDMCGDDELLCGNGLQQTSTNSYTVSQKYKTIGNGAPIPMNEYQITLKTEDDENCGYIRPIYKMEKVAGYLCDYETYTKYERYARMVSYDSGVTWSVAQPLYTERGEVIAEESYDCGKPMYRWFETDEFVCVDNGDDYKVAVVDSSGTVISSVTCSDSTLTSEDVDSISVTGASFSIGNCVKTIGSIAFSNCRTGTTGGEYPKTIYPSIISMGDYVEHLQYYAFYSKNGLYLGHVYDDNQFYYDIPLVLSRNLKTFGYQAFNTNGLKFVEFTTQEPPSFVPDYQGITSYTPSITALVPYGSLMSYKNCSWSSGSTFMQVPYTAATDDYKLAMEYSGITFYLGDDGGGILTQFETSSLLDSINYYLRSNHIVNMGDEYINLKAWVGNTVRTIESGAFPNRYPNWGKWSWYTEIYIESDTPPMVYNDSFTSLTTYDGNNVKLIVPCGSLDDYMEDENWSTYVSYLEPTTPCE